MALDDEKLVYLNIAQIATYSPALEELAKRRVMLHSSRRNEKAFIGEENYHERIYHTYGQERLRDDQDEVHSHRQAIQTRFLHTR